MCPIIHTQRDVTFPCISLMIVTSSLWNFPSSVLNKTPLEKINVISYNSLCLRRGNAWVDSNPNPIYIKSFSLGIRGIQAIRKKGWRGFKKVYLLPFDHKKSGSIIITESIICLKCARKFIDTFHPRVFFR